MKCRINECLVDRRAVELAVFDVLDEWKLGNRELVLDRSRLLLADLDNEQIADDTLGLMLAFDGGGHDLVEGGLHALEFELAYRIAASFDVNPGRVNEVLKEHIHIGSRKASDSAA